MTGLQILLLGTVAIILYIVYFIMNVTDFDDSEFI